MPTLRPDKGGRWLARVVLDGRQSACKMFPPGKKFGPQWRAAKKWEEEQLAKALQELIENPEKRKRMGANSRRMAEERFDRRNTYQQIVRAVEDLAR